NKSRNRPDHRAKDERQRCSNDRNTQGHLRAAQHPREDITAERVSAKEQPRTVLGGRDKASLREPLERNWPRSILAKSVLQPIDDPERIDEGSMQLTGVVEHARE